MTIRKAVIPAAGRGTRLYPLTKSQPKEMLPLGRKPTIQHVAEEVAASGCDRIVIVTGRNKRAIEDHFDRAQHSDNHPEHNGLYELYSRGVSFFYTRQAEPQGLGAAVLTARGFTADEPFVVALGDVVMQGALGQEPLLARMVRTFAEREAVAVVAVREVAPETVSRYGIVCPATPVGACFRIGDLVEKPAPEAAPSNLAITARYVFAPQIHDYLARTPQGLGGEVQLTDAIQLMAQEGLSVWGVRLEPGERRHDVGDIGQYIRAFLDVCLADEELGAELQAYVSGLACPAALGEERQGVSQPPATTEKGGEATPPTTT